METYGKPAETSDPAEELFDRFLYSDNNVLTTLEQFSELKTLLGLNDVPHYQLFSKLKAHFTSWKLSSFMEILQRRINVKEYVSSVEKCKDCKIFIIGAGPCGLRCAIEAALCGAYVVVAEKRTSFTRNNVLHLWPYLIHDLRNLGIKKLFGKFCAGSLDHISIRRLQLILMKIALVLGVKVFVNTSFVEYLEPCNSTGWRISVKPSNTEIEMTDFDVLVGADGKRNSIPGFQRKEFRAKLAIGITANFKNKNSDEEAKIEEISGVAALFNQKFFADLKTETSIDLENIVYYKDDTHYFVMTAKKQCLLKKGVLKEDHNDVMKLLAYQNVDNSELLNFVSEAADFSTGLPHSEFAINPDNGKPDVAIFDFTSMYSAEYAAKILERRDKRLIIGLVGDGLMEPFWPLGTGCARGFLSCMDLMWMIKQHQSGMEPIELLKERMALFQILHQTSNENMNKKHSAYTMNPKTRYKLIPKFTEDVSYLYENDEKENKRARTDRYSPEKTSPNKRLAGETTETVHKQWKKSTFARTRKPKNPSNESGVLQKKRSASPSGTSDQETLRQWCSDRLKLILPFLPVTDLDSCWRDGVLLCGLVHLCAPSEIDMAVVKSNTDSQNVDLAITVMFNEFGIQTLTAQDVLPPSGPDLLAIMSTILELQKCYQTVDSALMDGKSAKKKKLTSSENEKISSKPPSTEQLITPQKPEAPTPMDVDMPSPGALKKRVHSQRKVRKKTEAKFIAQVDNVEALAPNTPQKETPVKGSQKCHTCALSVLVLKRITVEGYVFHRKCFVCEECGTSLKTSTYHLITSPDATKPGRFFCKTHFTEIMSRSRELKKTSDKKPQTRNKEKKAPRPASAHYDSVKISNKSFRPSTPVVPEDAVPSEITPTKPKTKPEKPSRTDPKSSPDRPAPPSSTGPATVPSPESRYRDTALLIHKDKTSNKRGPESPALNKRSESAKSNVDESVTSKHRPTSPQAKQVPDPKSPKLAGRIKITETKSPELARTRTASSRLGKEAGAKKVASFHEDLPTEGIPDSTRKYSGPRGASSVPVDLLPSESFPPQPLPPNSNITVRKKSKKAHKAPAPPQDKTKDKSSGSEHSLHSGSPDSRDRSKSAGASKFAYKKKSEHSTDFVADEGWTQPMISRTAARMSPSLDVVEKTSDKPAVDIASGVKGRVIKDAGVKKVANTKPPQKPRPETRHARASSVSQVETYIPEFSRQLQDNISLKVDEGGPVSVKDRIALCAQRDLQTSSSFSAGARKRVEVSSDLKKSVNRDGSRIAASRGKVETDSTPSKFTRAQNIRRKRLRLKPTNKANQRRLAQAQQIQRDRSVLEQKMTEFENTAAEIEMLLRDSGNDDKHLLSQFLELVNMKNEMTRRENELHLCEKYLQLMDEQDQIERDLRYLLEMKDSEKEEEDHLEEEELILKKFDVVNRRDYLLTQLDDNKRREEEENKQINDMLASKGMSSKQYSYNTESFLTIESLLEPDDEKPDEDVEDTLEMFEQSTAQVQRRQKKGRKDGDENAISRFFNRMSIFN
ncbi:hypothetical protein ACHWQZ_G001675 [Mnemiopsis leidyi]